MSINLSEGQVIEAAKDYVEDVDFLFKIVDNCEQYTTVIQLIKKLYDSLPENEKESVSELINNVSGCLFIDINKQTPTREQEGEKFICKFETAINPTYEVCEWFNPLLDDMKAIEDHEKPHFLFDLPRIGQQFCKKVLVGWANIE